MNKINDMMIITKIGQISFGGNWIIDRDVEHEKNEKNDWQFLDLSSFFSSQTGIDGNISSCLYVFLFVISAAFSVDYAMFSRLGDNIESTMTNIKANEEKKKGENRKTPILPSFFFYGYNNINYLFHSVVISFSLLWSMKIRQM